jgi:hypothetical protein
MRSFFGQFGTVVEARIILHRDTNKPRGFGFVSMSSVAEADAVMNNLQGADFMGRQIRIDRSSPKGQGPPGGRGGGNFEDRRRDDRPRGGFEDRPRGGFEDRRGGRDDRPRGGGFEDRGRGGEDRRGGAGGFGDRGFENRGPPRDDFNSRGPPRGGFDSRGPEPRDYFDDRNRGFGMPPAGNSWGGGGGGGFGGNDYGPPRDMPRGPPREGGRGGGVCFSFQKGTCTRGADCRFQHVLEGAPGGGAQRY